ncbi:MAG: GNAT family N-acetyltransferase [Xanthomonadales bacterium]|nr:GNAT family N-acetyltransferase [Xanthomonadales bacterium]
MNFIIRSAQLADAPRLSAFAALTFGETFAGDNTPEDMARYLGETFAAERQAAEIADPTGAVLLAVAADRDGRVADEFLAYAHLVAFPAPATVGGDRPIELRRFYVARAWQGRGVAGALMDAVLDAARERTAEVLWLGVWERNARALAFYRRHGFRRVGEHVFVLGDDRQTDWILARDIA